MFPVNVMPRHQRPERTGSKNTEQSFRANECKKEIYCRTRRIKPVWMIGWSKGDLLVKADKRR